METLFTPSIHGHKYFLPILDDFSRFVWIILLKSKAEVQSHVKNFILIVENQYSTSSAKVKIVRIDNGPEFLLTQFYTSKGILRQRSCVETPQQNGRVGRKHQHILNIWKGTPFF